jgi:hypothetical protein
MFLVFYVGLLVYTLVFTVAVKWIVIGRYKEGTYPLWGAYVEEGRGGREWGDGGVRWGEGVRGGGGAREGARG